LRIINRKAYNTIMDSLKLNQYSEFLVKTFEEEKDRISEKGLSVSPIAAEIAAWYEKLRTAIENRDEEVILRAAIERIIRRRMLLGGNGKSVAMPLIRELVWARYFPDESIGEEKIAEVEQTIDRYLELKDIILEKNKIQEAQIHEWIYQLMSSDIEDRLNPTVKKEAMISYIFHNLSKMVTIKDDTQEIRDVQAFIAIRKSYAREDLAFLRYNLFNQYFGRLSEGNIEKTAQRFLDGRDEIDRQLNYQGRFKVFEFVKRQIPPFLILEDLLRKQQGKFRELISNPEALAEIVAQSCEEKYSKITAKVRRAIIRSVIFILLSKVFLAFTIEGTYERYVYGEIKWLSIALNIIIPVSLMIILSFFLKAPGKDNTERIIARINSLLFDQVPQLGKGLIFSHKPKARNAMDTIFTIVWFATFVLSFGAIFYVLNLLRFNIVSQFFFIFFFAIVTFLSYRIKQAADLYTVKDKQSILTPFVDFFFMPIARVGRYLAEGISQINIFVFLLDLIIETPFKGLIAFFEQWFFFLHSKREDLS